MFRNVKILALSSAALGLAVLVGPANAGALVDQGITYDLTAPSLNGPTEEFTLTISGINAPGDAEGGRRGFDAIAFTTSGMNFSNASFISGTGVITPFTTQDGGLNSKGCDGSGGFFCFKGFEGAPAGATTLAPNSSLQFVFDVTLSSGNFPTSFEGFKIDWVGTQNNYDLVSKQLDINIGSPPVPVPAPVGVPEPSTLALLGGLLLGLFGIRGLRRV
jgi:hypothetical protein